MNPHPFTARWHQQLLYDQHGRARLLPPPPELACLVCGVPFAEHVCLVCGGRFSGHTLGRECAPAAAPTPTATTVPDVFRRAWDEEE